MVTPLVRAVPRLLHNVGSKEEVEHYLRVFTSKALNFAVIAVSDGVIEKEIPMLSSSLTFLKNVGLLPVVVHGCDEGKREILNEPQIFKEVMEEQSSKIVESLEKMGTKAWPFMGGIFQAPPENKPFGFKVSETFQSSIKSSVSTGNLPIIASIAESPNGQLFPLSTEEAMKQIALSVKPSEIVYLNKPGGLVKGEEGETFDMIHLEEDFARLIKEKELDPKTRKVLLDSHQILSHLPASTTVSITSASNLIKEPFVHQGAGTFIQKGMRIIHYQNSFKDLDIHKLKSLASHDPSVNDSVFQSLEGSQFSVFVDDHYSVAAAVVQKPRSVPELKFIAISPDAQGLDARSNLWNRIRKEYQQIFWVLGGSTDLTWSQKECDGNFKLGDVHLFWCGLDDLSVVDNLVKSVKSNQ